MQELEAFRAAFRLDGDTLFRTATGKPVLCSPTRKSYAQVTLKVDGRWRTFRVHRVKFALLHGYLPTTVDHQNAQA